MSSAHPIFVYTRPWNAKQFHELANGIWPNVAKVSVSEHGGLDGSGFFNAFYRAEKALTEDSAPLYLTEVVLKEVFIRCRLLRALPSSRARKLILAAERAIEEILDEHSPRSMLSLTTDSYILHLFVLCCKRRQIPFIGIVPSFLNGHFRISALGERVAVRHVTDKQIEAAKKSLMDVDYKPTFLAKTSKEIHARARRLWWRNIIKPHYFLLRRYLGRDPLNYHYWSTQIVARQYAGIKMQHYGGQTLKSRCDLPAELQNRPIIFLPLQMSPEATIDYWSRDIRWVDYENRVIELLQQFAETHTFLIKEHPNVLGFRSPGFYRRLMDSKNAVLIDPAIASNSMLNLSDAILLCTGTVGFEAALRGVPVYSDSGPFHLPEDAVLPISTLASQQPVRYVSPERQDVLVRYALEGVLPGKFINDGTWRAGIHDQTLMIDSLRSVISSGVL